MTITDATGQALIAAWRAKYPGAGWPTLSDAKEMLCAALANGKALLSNELLPCPVCGSAFLISQEPHDNHLVAGKFYIFHEYGPIGSAARACPIDVPKHFDTREEAIAAWNTRTPDPELLAARRTIEGAAGDVIAERQRQVETEGWTPEHDDEHAKGEMARAAACYVLVAAATLAPLKTAARHVVEWLWPWDARWWKPTDRRRDLVKAGALIIAEIERLDRAALSNSGEQVK